MSPRVPTAVHEPCSFQAFTRHHASNKHAAVSSARATKGIASTTGRRRVSNTRTQQPPWRGATSQVSCRQQKAGIDQDAHGGGSWPRNSKPRPWRPRPAFSSRQILRLRRSERRRPCRATALEKYQLRQRVRPPGIVAGRQHSGMTKPIADAPGWAYSAWVAASI